MKNGLETIEKVQAENAALKDEIARLHWRVAELEELLTATHRESRSSSNGHIPQFEILYRTIVRNFPNGAVVLFDHNLRYLIAGGTGLTETGLCGESMEGKTIWEIFPPETCTGLEKHYRAALEGKTTHYEVHYNCRVYRTYALPVHDEHGTIVAGMVMTQDVTESRQPAQKLYSLNNGLDHALRTADCQENGTSEPGAVRKHY